MARRQPTTFDRVLEQVSLLATFVRVLRGEDPKKVREQQEQLIARTTKLKDEIEAFPTRGAPSSSSSATPDREKH